MYKKVESALEKRREREWRRLERRERRGGGKSVVVACCKERERRWKNIWKRGLQSRERMEG
jgi:hypothetical protein